MVYAVLQFGLKGEKEQGGGGEGRGASEGGRAGAEGGARPMDAKNFNMVFCRDKGLEHFGF